jgi:hypothetical protein
VCLLCQSRYDVGCKWILKWARTHHDGRGEDLKVEDDADEVAAASTERDLANVGERADAGVKAAVGAETLRSYNQCEIQLGSSDN